MVKIKICGITNKEDMAYISQKVHAVGMIIDVPVETPRKITLKKAVELKKYVYPLTSIVAVIMPKDIEEVLKVENSLKPNAIQLHGNEDIEFLKRLNDLREDGKINSNLIKVLHIPKEDANLSELIKTAKEYEKYCDALLVDTKIEKIKIKGKTHNWKISKTIRKSIKKPLILAGGLNKDNVKNAIEVVKPYAIDVSSSLESEKGKKDFKKVDEFLSSL
ncbi:phosphoribosylanthranilate isomerase [Methanotorris formicicus]|uniref:N-(5'-phosphoribosyl)anthranilate isomerase n=1 Tax=Methanotorris formicicus Mc-S-70 TaxID=647171 RepID=H1KWX2_9EURY|nr:phosphoribosylanthranilate isomerase [Methanotorris formicicus]EHP89105.1 Phosphoribosylanthranilate isomerase [Methanotorris formicicus Mc-S-70]